MKPDLHIGIAAYNEENHIETCLESLNSQKFQGNLETVVCLNGCTDETEKKVLLAKEKFGRLNINIIHSSKGIAFAQNAIVKYNSTSQAPLMFVDADVTLDNNCSQILYDELDINDSLLVAGAWPMPKKPDKMTKWESILFDVFHARSHFPESEVSTHDVSKYKSYVDKFPQKGVSQRFEKKSKIYFHGRAFMVRNAQLYDIPPRKDVCDDTYMPNYIHSTFGPGTIRTRYDAEAYYDPYLSLTEHFKTYRRIYLDLRHVDRTAELFSDSRNMEKTKLDWGYIMKQEPRVVSTFLAHMLIAKTEKICFSLMPKKGLSELWEYQKK